MLKLQLAEPAFSSPRADPVGEAAACLEAALPPREDAQVLVDFLTDELREGLAALDGVEAHFTDVLDALRAERLSPLALVEAAENVVVLDQLETLEGVVRQLRRRLSQAAGKIALQR
jgi:hypothetical protein